MLAGAEEGASAVSSGDISSRAHQDNVTRETGNGTRSTGASCRYDSNSSGLGDGALYNAASQLSSSRFPFPVSRFPSLANPISHSSRYMGCASDTPNRESLRAGKVKSGSPLRAG